MKLNIQERLTLIGVVPQKGNFETMSTIENLKLLLYPSEEEVKKYNIKQSEDRIEWSAEASTEPVEIPMTSVQRDLILKELNRISQEENLLYPQYSIFKRFKTEDETKKE
jgi:hypothetical protein